MDIWMPAPGVEPGRAYSKAPITQAILEINVASQPDLAVEDLSSIEFAGFEASASILEVSGEFSYADGEVVGSTTGSKVGTGFVDAEDKRTIQAALHKFAFVWRGHYTAWDDFLGEAMSQWEAYRQACDPVAVESLGLRYINHIPLPERSIEIRDYLRTSIDVAPSLPQAIAAFFMQVDLPLPEQLCPSAAATLTSSIVPGTGAELSQGLLLDIDVHSEAYFDTQVETFHELLHDRLAMMRDTKNYIFEACITDATRGLIQ